MVNPISIQMFVSGIFGSATITSLYYGIVSLAAICLTLLMISLFVIEVLTVEE